MEKNFFQRDRLFLHTQMLFLNRFSFALRFRALFPDKVLHVHKRGNFVMLYKPVT